MRALERLVEQAQRNGWASGEGRVLDVESQAVALGWTLVPSRKSGPNVDQLKPTTPEDAPRQSLSARTGLGEQALHTDGAYHVRPPDIVVLAAVTPSQVPTLLWSLSDEHVPSQTMHDLRHGLFTVRGGSEPFLASALRVERGGRRLRFDSGCMTPSDDRARRAAIFLSTLARSATLHDWSTIGILLAIDNRKVLHARGSAVQEPERTVQRIAFRLSEATS